MPIMDTTTTEHARPLRAAEAKPEAYLRQIRNILGWMLTIWLVSIAAAVGVGVYLGHQAAQQTADNGGICQSLGGTNPSC